MDNLEKIYLEVAQEMGLSKGQIKSIAEAQFSLVADTIRAKDLNNVRLQYLGSFKIKPARLKHLSDQAKEQIKTKIDELNPIL